MGICASAPGKAILFGEHAVVYGAPAIAVPLSSIRARATASVTNSPLTIIAEDLARPPLTIEAVDLDLADPLALMSRLTMRHLGVASLTGEIRLRSDIPIASGLGSGAAVSAALGRAIARLSGKVIGDDDLSRLVFEVEKLHHGTPSGIDNAVVAREKPLYFVKDRPIEVIGIGAPLWLIVADTGIASPTRDAVSAVRSLRQRQPKRTARTFDEIGEIVRAARTCLERGAAAPLGALMTANHHLLQSLAVSSRELDWLVEAALGAGALGAKLSGGGRGGNIIALADGDSAESIGRALLEAGAKRVTMTVAGAGPHHDDDID